LNSDRPYARRDPDPIIPATRPQRASGFLFLQPLCGVGPGGITSFSTIQLAADSGNAAALVFFVFDLLYLDGEDLFPRPLIERKTRLTALLANVGSPLHYSDHQVGHGRAFFEKACAMSVEGIVSRREHAPYVPGNRGLWRKVKCLHRKEFVVVGWTDPEGSRPYLGALLLADPEGRLVYAGRASTGIRQAELARLWRRLQPSRPPRCRSWCRRHGTAALDRPSC
jgi:bifunctional non-homologous end joining protein LigD